MSVTQLPPLSNRDLSTGMISYVAPFLLPANAATQIINMNTDVLGRVTQRNGTSLLGTAPGTGNCLGLFHWKNSDGSKNLVVADFNTTIYAYNGTNWQASTANTTTTDKVRFRSFLNRLFRVGGGDATLSWSGVIASPWDTTDAVNAPSGQYIETYKDRVYIAGNTGNPDRLFFSTISSTAGTITWSNSTQYLDVNPEDGNVITGLGKISNLLIIFKERSLYRWNGTATDAEVIVDVGCTSNESIAAGKNSQLFFFNPSGIYITDGGYPLEISRPIYDWIQAISPSFYTEVSGVCDDDHYYCHVGNITKGGRTYNNVILVYTMSSKNWAVYQMGDSFRFMARYRASTGTVSTIGGDTSGEVQTLFSSATTDNGKSIVYEHESKEFEIDSRATTKSIVNMVVYMANGAGSNVYVSEDSRPYRPLGEVTGLITYLNEININAHFFKIKVSGSNASTPVNYDGFEFTKLMSLGYITS